jgi:hypothetical protein
MFQHPIDAAAAWELVAVSVALSLIFHAFVELDRESVGTDGPAPAALVAIGGFFGLLFLAGAMVDGIAPWPWLVAWTALTALLYRQASFPDRAPLQLAATLALGLCLSVVHMVHHTDPAFPGPWTYLGLLVAAAAVVYAVSHARRRAEQRLWADHAAAALPGVLLLCLGLGPLVHVLGVWVAIGTSLVLGLLMLLTARRLANGSWYAAALLLTAFVHWSWTGGEPSDVAISGLALQLGSVMLFTGWLFVGRSFADSRQARWAAALAAPIWFPPMRNLYETAFGEGTIGLLPVLLGGVSLVAVVRTRTFWSRDEPQRLSALVWFSAVALGFLSIAVPLQLDKEWITIGWALEGFAVIVLWKRLDHAGLKYFGLGLLAAVTLRLVANPELLGYHARSGIRIFNWLLYTYIVPAAALLGSAAVLRPLEVARWREGEKKLIPRSLPLGAIATSMAAVVVIFVWINLTIADWFATGETITLSFGTDPAQRLTLSIAWAVYALVLLGLGMLRDTQGLRWVSLAFLMVTIVKVFLYDLGHLRDLYRVASLVGLALSLIFVSLLYQRFVLHRSREESGSV